VTLTSRRTSSGACRIQRPQGDTVATTGSFQSPVRSSHLLTLAMPDGRLPVLQPLERHQAGVEPRTSRGKGTTNLEHDLAVGPAGRHRLLALGAVPLFMESRRGYHEQGHRWPCAAVVWLMPVRIPRGPCPRRQRRPAWHYGAGDNTRRFGLAHVRRGQGRIPGSPVGVPPPTRGIWAVVGKNPRNPCRSDVPVEGSRHTFIGCLCVCPVRPRRRRPGSRSFS
jgi:hypothetical protein